MTPGPANVLTKEEQRLVLPLVRDCLGDCQVYGILADLFNDAFPLLAKVLRDAPCYRYLLVALDLGDWKARAHARMCRGVVFRAAHDLCADRRVDPSGVEVLELGSGYAWVSPGETAGFLRGHSVHILAERYPNVFAAARRTWHCRHLIWNALGTEAIVMELAPELGDLHAAIRNAINHRCV